MGCLATLSWWLVTNVLGQPVGLTFEGKQSRKITELTSCPATSVSNYQETLCPNTEEQKPHQHLSGRFKSHIKNLYS